MKSLPVLFISGIVGWSYYAYVIALLLYAMEDYPVEQVMNKEPLHLGFRQFVDFDFAREHSIFEIFPRQQNLCVLNVNSFPEPY